MPDHLNHQLFRSASARETQKLTSALTTATVDYCVKEEAELFPRLYSYFGNAGTCFVVWVGKSDVDRATEIMNQQNIYPEVSPTYLQGAQHKSWTDLPRKIAAFFGLILLVFSLVHWLIDLWPRLHAPY